MSPLSPSSSTPITRVTLPIAGLLALAMTGFLCIATETLPAGLLPEIARSLSISPSMAGQLVTAYAAGSLLAAIPLTLLTSHWSRRRALLLTVAGFLLFNALTAVSSLYWLTLLARFMAGAAAGLAWSLLAAYARRMVAPAQQGQALAIAMVGTPIALSLGVPFGTWLGAALTWRYTFGLMSLLAVGLVGWILAAVPDYPGQTRSSHLPATDVLTTPGVRPVLLVVIFWMLAHNVLYTYVAPFLVLSHLQLHVDALLLVFGLSSLVGIAVSGRLVDTHLRQSILANLLLFAALSVSLAFLYANPTAVIVAVALWGLSFGGAATLLQTALADAAGEGADVALSMNVVAWNSAIAGGGILGGVVLKTCGAAAFPVTMVVLIGMAFGIAAIAHRHGFPGGRRNHAS